MSIGPAGVALFVFAGLLSALLAWPLRRRLLALQLVDLPGERRSHEAPTPRGGGLAIVAAFGVAWLAWPDLFPAGWPVMFAVAAMAALGWGEDRYELPRSLRLAAQALTALVLVGLAGGIETVVVLGLALNAPWLWSGLAVVACVWLINLYNFMDGADGLAAGQGAWVGLVFAGLFEFAGERQFALLALAAAGAWAGFLVWNRPPARLFMGDTGSLSLGALVASFALLGAGGSIGIGTSFMVSSLFVVDATATLVRRVCRGERWYTAHRQHAYQRLLDLGFGHGRVLGGFMLVNVLVILPAVVMAVAWPELEAALAAALAVLLLSGWGAVQRAAATNNDKARV